MHIELRENLTKVSEDIKQRMYGQLNKAWSSLAEFTKLPRVLTSSMVAADQNQSSSNSSLSSSNQNNDLTNKDRENLSINLQDIIVEVNTQINFNQSKTILLNYLEKHDFILQNLNATNTFEKPKIFMGKVNKGRRIDYVLQG